MQRTLLRPRRARSAPQLRILDEAGKELPKAEIPKAMQKGSAGNMLSMLQPDKVLEVIARIHRKAAQRKVNRSDLEKLELELLSELGPVVRLALSGLVYAYYFRPDDLLISDDPLFVRKHWFAGFVEIGKPPVFAPSEMEIGGNVRQFGGFPNWHLCSRRFRRLCGAGRASRSRRRPISRSRIVCRGGANCRYSSYALGRLPDRRSALACVEATRCARVVRSRRVRRPLAGRSARRGVGSGFVDSPHGTSRCACATRLAGSANP